MYKCDLWWTARPRFLAAHMVYERSAARLGSGLRASWARPGARARIRLRRAKNARSGVKAQGLRLRARAFVEPEVLPGGAGHQVAGPAVRDLVADDAVQGAVARQQRGRDEGQARVLHAAVREAGRKHQQVIHTPAHT